MNCPNCNKEADIEAEETCLGYTDFAWPFPDCDHDDNTRSYHLSCPCGFKVSWTRDNLCQACGWVGKKGTIAFKPGPQDLWDLYREKTAVTLTFTEEIVKKYNKNCRAYAYKDVDLEGKHLEYRADYDKLHLLKDYEEGFLSIQQLMKHLPMSLVYMLPERYPAWRFQYDGVPYA